MLDIDEVSVSANKAAEEISSSVEKIIQDLDEASDLVIKTMPKFLRRFYLALLDEGFTATESMDFTKAYVAKLF